MNRRPRSPALALGIVLAAVWVAWIWWEASLSPTRWGSLGTFVVLLLAVGLNALGVRARMLGPARLVMVAVLLAFVGWNFLSILWADSRASAWNGADKTLIYAAGFLALTLWPWHDRGIAAMLGVLVAAVGSTGAVVLVQVAFGDDLGAFLEEGRLVHPTGYANGNAAVWTTAAIPAVYLAASRWLHPVLRGLAMAIAVATTELAVLAQSRGWLFVLPFVVVLVVLLARERLRTLFALLVTGAATVAVLQPLLDVEARAVAGELVEPAADRAAVLVLVSSLAAGCVVVAWAAADRRLDIPNRVRRGIGIAVLAAVVVGIGVGAALLARAADDARSEVSKVWQDFTRGYSTGSEGSRFTGSLGTDRYQQWQVAWAEFREHPLVGIGADNFAAPYLLRRKDNVHEPFFPHSIPLRLLSQLGIVGTVLFLVFIGIAVWLALRRRGLASPALGGATGTALAVTGYWLVHGSLDVFWEIPVLASSAFGLLGAVASPRPEEAERVAASYAVLGPVRQMSGNATKALRLAAATGAGTVAAAACVSLVLPWLSYSYATSAGAVWREDPDLAYDRLELAAHLNPLNAQPLVRKGLIAAELGDDAEARRAFERALEREPSSWYAHLQLALIAADAGDHEGAAHELREARALNPQDPVLRIMAELIAAGEPVDRDVINYLYNERLNRQSYAYLTTRYIQVPPFTVEG